MKGELDRGVIIAVMAALLLMPRSLAFFEGIVLLAAAYAVWRISPSVFLTGSRSGLDDAVLALGLMLLHQRFVAGLPGDLAGLLGALILFGFGLVVVATLKVKRESLLARFRNRAKWQQYVRACAFTWILSVMIFRAVVTWLWEQPLFGFFVLLPLFFRPGVAGGLFYRRKGVPLGLAGLLVLHSVGGTLAAATRIGFHPSLQWLFGIVGFGLLLALPPYMWYTTLRIRKGHVRFPDWPPWRSALVSALVVFPLFWPVVKLSPGLEGVSVVPVLPSQSLLPFLVALTAGFFVLGVGLFSPHLRRLVMLGPFLAGAYFLGLYAYTAFVSEFGMLTRFASLLSLPVAILTFVAMTFSLVLGYFSFLYELWRD